MFHSFNLRKSLSFLFIAFLLNGCVGPFSDETNRMFPAAVSSVGCSAQPNETDLLYCDRTEKDIAQGDLNNDGYEDFIIARKVYLSKDDCLDDPSNPHDPIACDEEWSNLTPEELQRSAVILLNQRGVLQDVTPVRSTWKNESEHMTARDVALADLNNDTFPDAIFANTAFERPRIYLNRGVDASGNWLGFESTALTPNIMIRIGDRDINPAIAPFAAGSTRDMLFCAITTGDVDGDGDTDLYFSNYLPGPDGGAGGGTADVLLINNFINDGVTTGIVSFTDETEQRLGDLRYAAFGTDAEIIDVDGRNGADIVKISVLYPVHPFERVDEPILQGRTVVLFNDGNGIFHDGDTLWTDDYESANAILPYMFDIGDYNGDGVFDLYEVTDETDMINFGVRMSSGRITFPAVMAFKLTREDLFERTSGFGGNIQHLTRGDERRIKSSASGTSPTATPLPDDDVVALIGLAPIDVQFEITSCRTPPHRFNLFRNLSDNEEWIDLLESDEAIIPSVSGPGGDPAEPWSLLAHDFAFTDIDEDGRIDIFFGLCNGYRVLRGVQLDLSELELGRR